MLRQLKLLVAPAMLLIAMGVCKANEPDPTQPISHFAIDRTEVTIGQFKLFAKATGTITKAERAGGGLVYAQGWEQKVWMELACALWPARPGR